MKGKIAPVHVARTATRIRAREPRSARESPGPMNEVGGGVEIQADTIPFGDALDKTPHAQRERRDAGVLFAQLAHVDSLGIGRSAPEVGAILEAFFKTAGDVADAHGGYAERRYLWAVQCVFGAPASCRRAADAALASGRELHARLVEELPEVASSIGISVGASVAGWIQAMRRFEPLIIRAPVSEARRLCELARRGGPSLLASERAVARATPSEAGRWSSAALAGVTGFPAATLTAHPVSKP